MVWVSVPSTPSSFALDTPDFPLVSTHDTLASDYLLAVFLLAVILWLTTHKFINTYQTPEVAIQQVSWMKISGHVTRIHLARVDCGARDGLKKVIHIIYLSFCFPFVREVLLICETLYEAKKRKRK